MDGNRFDPQFQASALALASIRDALDRLLPFREREESSFALTRQHRLEVVLATLALLGCFLWMWSRLDVVMRTYPDGTLVDPMAASGFITSLIGLVLTLFLERRYLAMLRGLEQDGLTDLSHAQLERLNDDLQLAARKYRYWTMGIIVAVMVVGYFAYFGWPEDAFRWEFFLSSWLLAALAGHRLGIAAAYGGFAQRLGHLGARIRLIPGHSDGVGGVNRIGGFLLYQGLLASIPVFWLTVWIALIGVFGPTWFIETTDADLTLKEVQQLTAILMDKADTWQNCTGWLQHYFMLWLIAFVLMFLGAVAPVFALRRMYRAAKADLLSRLVADCDREIADGHALLLKADTYAQGTVAAKALNGAVAFRQSMTTLPDLPLSGLGRWLFAVTSLFPIVTFVLDLVLGDKSMLGQFIGWIIKLAGGAL